MKKVSFIVLQLFCLVTFSFTVFAASYTVTNTNNSGAGSLRQAIIDANSSAGDDSISFAIPANDPNCTAEGVCTITLISGQLAVNSTSTAGRLMIINSTGASNLKISGNNASRIFFVNTGGDLALNGITIMNGFALDTGGIYNLGAITLINTTVTGNFATNIGGESFRGSGGGIYNRGTAQVISSTVSRNTSVNNGGGIYNGGGAAILTITNSTISDNKALGVGGGIGNISGTVTLTNSTVSGNTASHSGGIDISLNGTAALINSTVSGNTATLYGGIFKDGDAVLTLTNSTVTGNRGTSTNSENVGGIINTASLTILNNTIVAGNTVANPAAFPDFRGFISPSSSYNLIGNNRGIYYEITNNINGNQVGTPTNPIDPRLAPLANNGGATQTHALLFDSPAIDKGNSFGATTDQRGFLRPIDFPGTASIADGTDIGAFELQSATAATVTVEGRVIKGRRGVSKARVYRTDQNGETVTALTNSFGYYRFDNVSAGQTYVFNVISKFGLFSPQVVAINQEMNLDFIADQ